MPILATNPSQHDFLNSVLLGLSLKKETHARIEQYRDIQPLEDIQLLDAAAYLLSDTELAIYIRLSVIRKLESEKDFQQFIVELIALVSPKIVAFFQSPFGISPDSSKLLLKEMQNFLSHSTDKVIDELVLNTMVGFLISLSAPGYFTQLVLFSKPRHDANLRIIKQLSSCFEFDMSFAEIIDLKVYIQEREKELVAKIQQEAASKAEAIQNLEQLKKDYSAIKKEFNQLVSTLEYKDAINRQLQEMLLNGQPTKVHQ